MSFYGNVSNIFTLHSSTQVPLAMPYYCTLSVQAELGKQKKNFELPMGSPKNQNGSEVRSGVVEKDHFTSVFSISVVTFTTTSLRHA